MSRLRIASPIGAMTLLLCTLTAPAATLPGGPSLFDHAGQRTGVVGGVKARVQHALDARLPVASIGLPAAPPGVRRFAFGAPREESVESRESARRDEVRPGADGSGKQPVALPLNWQNTPEWQRTARSYRHAGLPILHLWESSHALVAVGLSRHGVPGIYLTQKLAN